MRKEEGKTVHKLHLQGTKVQRIKMYMQEEVVLYTFRGGKGISPRRPVRWCCQHSYQGTSSQSFSDGLDPALQGRRNVLYF
ncbi:hypothetical protein DUNSADRAFT_5530 [Dunaliella salina]|uniref:Uncharacterized protein n=1 Tax=Dunaliella salina TaxID=3046 RepID=A0ABQ7GQ54_DUNSA|nr:hypothetical protein DUNSADRAFT_5530 [Dunaliella salina]|eukprot:KAF5836741.1 hypothetical protein DUNSADRAFT_5530 [Dunaliella salina]